MVDRLFAPLRGKPGIDRGAALVSNLADYGFVWVLLAFIKGRHRGANRRRAILSLAAAGFSSLAVSRAAKSVVARQRPEEQLEAMVRTPTSSSFPSGHTLAAFCTAVVLADEGLQTTTAVGFASAVAASRVHLRAHHASDVVGGAAIGWVLGMGLRPLVNAVTPGTGRRRSRASRRTGGMGQVDYLLQRL